MGIVPVPPWYLSVGERGTDHELGEQTYKARWPNECLAEGEEQAAMMVDREREEQSSPIARGVIIYPRDPARAWHPTIPLPLPLPLPPPKPTDLLTPHHFCSQQ